ncbi:hypothetical protein [Mesoterricola sediminis]|uniref:Uncharacterized protein n=1 Tax=Mesoterricola sediminis TaxID=2927980 RepID=A0AA48GQC6_9BACT|nr:hypothetical protein [Mesoterricola sediminis]BDU75642.1 hypothetical protein METESE_06000 [Mesoterricola sediminis]
MHPFKPLVLSAMAALAATAQIPLDLNSLSASADRYLNRNLQASPYPITRQMVLMRGDNGGDAAHLMSKALDVQRWTVFYNLDGNGPTTDPLPKSASVKCVRGIFGDYHTAPKAVPDCKSIQDTWLAVNLDAAVNALVSHGYTRGFSQVEILRPDRTGFSDELVYLFTCPWERTRVAISASTGAYVWYQAY